ncbi:MAG: branched-chain amino acid ABC transporter permease [Chloroflexi bacterium]|nr:MAG: branched-chain amino acid ABC transporter permease [Chloroflexota bacterium]
MNWQLLPQFAITGLLNGGPIALIALGIVLIFKSSEIFNFAQGQMLLIGTMATWWFASPEGMGLPLPLAILAALGVSILLGLAIERFTLRPMTGQPLLSIILMTLALSQFLQGLTILIFGTVQRNFPVIFEVTNPYKITLPFQYNGNPIIVILKQNLVWSFIIAMVCVLVLWVFFQYTNTGLAMRATAEDHETAQSVGIRINRVFGISWAIAGIIANIGGILIATASGLDLSLPVVVLAAFPAVLLGGLESIPGAVVGGLVIGLAQGLVGLPNNDFFLGPEMAQAVRNSAEIVPYIILLVVLLFRPDGLFGQKRIERI